MPRFTTATLITTVKLKARLPSSQTDISNAEILELATEEMLGYMLPNILSANANYFKAVKDNTITSTTSAYQIPQRSIGNKLAGLYLLESGSSVEQKVPIVEHDEDAARVGSDDGYLSTVAYVRNDKIVLVPVPDTGTTLRMIYYVRPGDLVDATTVGAAASTIATVPGSTSLTVTANSFGLATGVAFDIVDVNSPFKYLGLDHTGTVSGTSVSAITPSLDSEVAVGDWVALSGQSPIPQIPYELHPTLVERTSARVLALLGDAQGFALTIDRAEKLEEQALRLLTPRVDNTTHKIVNTTGPRHMWNRGRFPWSGA